MVLDLIYLLLKFDLEFYILLQIMPLQHIYLDNDLGKKIKKVVAPISLVCCLMAILFSCEKDKLHPSYFNKKYQMVITGDPDTNSIFLELLPPLVISEEETACLTYSGKDSIDMDNNNIYELIF